MEAVAKHDFVATSDDELSFCKNDKLKIINMTDDENWFKAEKMGKEGWIPTNYINLMKYDWFVKKLSRAEAENLLMERTETNEYLHADGAFVVRPSESSPADFSLSVKFGDLVQHFKVLRDGAGKYFLWVVKFDSLNDLVKYHRTASVSRTQTVYLTDRTILKRIADYDYQAKEALEMSFRRGDIINVLNKSDPNWWMGEIETSNGECKQGLFPSTYTSGYSNRK